MEGFAILAMIAFALFVLWLWSLIHCITNKKLSDTNRIIYVLVIVLLGPLGSMVYFLMPWE